MSVTMTVLGQRPGQGMALAVIAAAQLIVVLDAMFSERCLTAYPAGARLLRDRPGMGGQRVCAQLRRAATARRPRRDLLGRHRVFIAGVAAVLVTRLRCPRSGATPAGWLQESLAHPPGRG